jgi:hypothetical protein
VKSHLKWLKNSKTISIFQPKYFCTQTDLHKNGINDYLKNRPNDAIPQPRYTKRPTKQITESTGGKSNSGI